MFVGSLNARHEGKQRTSEHDLADTGVSTNGTSEKAWTAYSGTFPFDSVAGRPIHLEGVLGLVMSWISYRKAPAAWVLWPLQFAEGDAWQDAKLLVA